MGGSAAEMAHEARAENFAQPRPHFALCSAVRPTIAPEFLNLRSYVPPGTL